MAESKLPDLVQEDPTEDVESVKQDIDTLIAKYLNPIINKRSYYAPTLSYTSSAITMRKDAVIASKSAMQLASKDPGLPQESMGSAACRLFGYPVVAANGEFFSPGFNPRPSRDDLLNQWAVASKVDEPVRKQHKKREDESRRVAGLFTSSPHKSSVFAVSMSIPGLQRKYNTEDIIEYNTDEQFSIPQRAAYVKGNYTYANGDEITDPVTSAYHIVRLISTDPSIDATVTPLGRRMATPFQTESGVFYEPGRKCDRPLIEGILFLRLGQQDDGTFNTNLIKSLSKASVEEGATEADLRRLANLLLNQPGLQASDSDIQEALKSRSNLEKIRLGKYVRLLKALVELHVEAIEKLSENLLRINWTPYPNKYGPLYGTTQGNYIGLKERRSDLARRIDRLKLKVSIADGQQASVSTEEDWLSYTDYPLLEPQESRASTGDDGGSGSGKGYQEELELLQGQEERFLNETNLALRTIEAIGGEASGWGIIDTVAHLTALWAIDTDSLVDLIDDVSFERLQKFKSISGAASVINRKNGNTKGVQAAQTAIQDLLSNIYSFCDRIYDNAVGNSDPDTKGGTLEGT